MLERPRIEDAHIVGPGLPVGNWPIEVDVDFKVTLTGAYTAVSWPNEIFGPMHELPRQTGGPGRAWKWFDPGHDKDERKLFGTVLVMYLGSITKQWELDYAEYLEFEHHDEDVVFNTQKKFERIDKDDGLMRGGGIPEIGTPVAYFVTGSSRYSKGLPMDQWRTPRSWKLFTGRQGLMAPYEWDDVVEPPPPTELELTAEERAEVSRLRGIWGR